MEYGDLPVTQSYPVGHSGILAGLESSPGEEEVPWKPQKGPAGKSGRDSPPGIAVRAQEGGNGFPVTVGIQVGYWEPCEGGEALEEFSQRNCAAPSLEWAWSKLG